MIDLDCFGNFAFDTLVSSQSGAGMPRTARKPLSVDGPQSSAIDSSRPGGGIDNTRRRLEVKQSRRLGMAGGMILHLATDSLDRPFCYLCRPAYYWRSSPIAKRGNLALWECGVVVSYFTPTNGLIEQCSLEDIDDVWCSYSSLQGLLAKLIHDGFEGYMMHTDLIKSADLFGFVNVERMLTEAKAAGENYSQWREQFPTTCAAA